MQKLRRKDVGPDGVDVCHVRGRVVQEVGCEEGEGELMSIGRRWYVLLGDA